MSEHTLQGTLWPGGDWLRGRQKANAQPPLTQRMVPTRHAGDPHAPTGYLRRAHVDVDGRAQNTPVTHVERSADSGGFAQTGGISGGGHQGGENMIHCTVWIRRLASFRFKKRV